MQIAQQDLLPTPPLIEGGLSILVNYLVLIYKMGLVMAAYI